MARRGGGTGTSPAMSSGLSGEASGHVRAGLRTTTGAARSRIITIFPAPAEGTAGQLPLEASRALLTAPQSSHGLPGSKVSRAAFAIDSVRTYPANMRPQANTWATSRTAPLAQSQAKRRERDAMRRVTGGKASFHRSLWQAFR